MKNFLLLVFAFVIMLPMVKAQNAEYIKLQNTAQIAKQKIQKVLQDTRLLDEFKVCEKIYEWDTVANQFEKIGDGTIEYEEMGAIKRMTISSQTWDEDGVTEFKVESYLSFQDVTVFGDEILGDSLLLWIGDGMGNYQLFSKTIFFYEGEKAVRSDSYIDFSIWGLPLGLALNQRTFYVYDNNDFLIEQVTESIDFDTFELEFQDSTVYENNNYGYPIVTTGYQADYFTGEVVPYFKEEYSYVNQYYVKTQLYYGAAGDTWLLETRTSSNYDNQNRKTELLTENTFDNGGTWENNYKTNSEYDEDLPLDLPSSDLDQYWFNGEWRNESLNTYEECTSNLADVGFYSFEAWFTNDQLNMKNLMPGEVEISVFDLSGKLYFKNKFENAPDMINVEGISRGIYIVQVLQEDSIGIQKVFR